MCTAGQSRPPSLATLIGSSDAIVATRRVIDRLAGSDAPVLISGPAGSGKRVVAELLHQRGSRAARPFVVVPGAVSTSDDADSRRDGGAAHRAAGGTLFVDGVGDLSMGAQAVFLRAVDPYHPGRSAVISRVTSDVRIVASTRVDIASAVATGWFSADLIAKLVVVVLPPLAARADDIPLLVEYFAELDAGDNPPPRFAADALAYLCRQPWPGNVRELRALVARAALRRGESEIDEAQCAVLLHGERRKVDRWLASAAAPLPLPNRRRPQPLVASGDDCDPMAVLTDVEQAQIREALGRTVTARIAASLRRLHAVDDVKAAPQ